MEAKKVKSNYNKKKNVKKINFLSNILSNSKRVNTTKLFK